MIEAEKLTMHYGPVIAVEDASFTVSPKEVVGLLGPNGAGKSTIMKILTTYLWPTSGTAKVCGKDILEDPIAVRRHIGYLPELLPLYMDMDVASYLRFVAGARGLSRNDVTKRLDWVIGKCGLEQVYTAPIRELSKGYKQRTGLAQALIHDPEVIIMDEPTSGLDPHQIVQIRALIRELAQEKTVILSTHILQEVEAVSDRIVIISQGNIVADGTMDSLRQKAMKNQRIELAVNAPKEEVEQSLRGLVSHDSVEFLKSGKDIVRCRIEAPKDKNVLQMVGELATTKNWEMRELLDMPYSLEETFLALTAPEGKGGKS